jgi:hypothetical protein
MKKFNWKSIMPHAMAVAVFLIIAVIYCKPALEGKVLQQSDITQWKGMAQQSFKYKETHGHFPLWTNSAFAGMPAYQISMESQNPISIAYLHHLFTLFLPEPISFFFLMCVSFYFLTQVLKIDYRLGILGSIGYAYASFSSIIIAVGHNTQVLALGYAPAFIGAVFLVFQKKYWVGGALTAIITSLFIAQNHPQVTYYFLIIAAFAGVAYLIHWLKQKEYKHIILSFSILGVAALLGAGVNMVTLATTLDFSKETMRNGTLNLDTSGNATRKTSGLPIDYAFQWSYGQKETFTLLVPDIYGGSGDGGTLDANSHIAKSAMSKGVQDDQAAQIASYMPTYWGPQLSTSGPVYAGAIMCFLFVFGLLYLKSFDRWWMLAVSIFAILLSWGSNFMDFNSFMFEHFPLYNKFRAPTMSLVIPQFLFPLLSIMALQQFIFNESDKTYAWKKLKLTGFVMGGIFLIMGLFYSSFEYKKTPVDSAERILSQVTQNNKDVAAGLFSALKEDRQAMFGSDILRSVFFVAVAFLFMWLLLKNKIKPLYALLGILLMGSIDVLAEGRRYLNDDKFLDAETTNQDIQPTAADQQILKDTGYYRVLDLSKDFSEDGAPSYFHNSIGGYSPAKLSFIEDLLNYQIRGNGQPNLQVLNMLNVKYIIVPGPQNQPQVQVNPTVLGPCWFVKGVNFVSGPAEAMKALNNFNARDIAVMENLFKNSVSFVPSADSTASIKLIKNDNDIITYTSTSKTSQLAIFSEIFYDRGWKAYVDDKEFPILKADYALRALALPAGNHNIRFEFKPASYYNSSAIAVISSAIIWLTVIAAIVVYNRKNKIA